MPFTFAHPAAILPFRHWFASSNGALSALVVGSVIPDFPYFFLFLPSADVTHSWVGLFKWCLPLAFVVWLFWRWLVVPLLIDVVPSFVGQRLRLIPVVWPKSIGAWLLALCAVCLGAATHLLWDGFTHRLGFVVQMFPEMEREVFAWQGYTLTVYRLLQHLSSLVGVSVLLFFCVRWWHSTPPEGSYQPRDFAWLLTVLVALLLMGVVRVWWFWGTFIAEKVLFLNVVWMIRWGLVVVALYVLFWHVRWWWCAIHG